MTIIERSSKRKTKAIKNLLDKGEFSVGYALFIVEQLSDEGKLTDADYEELAEYLENLLNEVEEVVEEPTDEEIEESEEGEE